LKNRLGGRCVLGLEAGLELAAEAKGVSIRREIRTKPNEIRRIRPDNRKAGRKAADIRETAHEFGEGIFSETVHPQDH
jgi:hypothetical protein